MKTIKIGNYELNVDGNNEVIYNSGLFELTLSELREIRKSLLPPFKTGGPSSRILSEYYPNKKDRIGIVWAVSEDDEIEQVYYSKDEYEWYCLEGSNLIQLNAEKWLTVPGNTRPTKTLARRMKMYWPDDTTYEIRFGVGMIKVGCQQFPNEVVQRAINALESEIKRVKKELKKFKEEIK